MALLLPILISMLIHSQESFSTVKYTQLPFVLLGTVHSYFGRIMILAAEFQLNHIHFSLEKFDFLYLRFISKSELLLVC
jgi:hypothetical protein